VGHSARRERHGPRDARARRGRRQAGGDPLVDDGRWLEPAQRYADIVTAALGNTPIWFFTCDPRGGDQIAVDWWADDIAAALVAG
jgi:hypothetical protein